ncbi:hypothetical protein F7725_025721 [Dissostichus mawsoni]|uniref:Uncharacterized protein n=1 Tax=Dissostichus mawsoni TaxID=36200 RepID=A0A7J5X526_DISMA|nr:hypothetical protein F7725_025721 [Dissostichus mawsoni]
MPPPLLYPMEADSDDSSGKSSDEDLQRSAHEEITELYFKFEVKEVRFQHSSCVLRSGAGVYLFTFILCGVCWCVFFYIHPLWCVQVLLCFFLHSSSVVLLEMLQEQSTVLSLSVCELIVPVWCVQVLLEMLQEQSTVLSLSVCELIVPVWCVQVLLEMLQEQSTVLSLSVCELIVPVWCVQVLFEMLREQSTVLSLSVCELGAEGRRRSFDLSVTAFLRRVALDFCDLPDGREPLHLVEVSSLDFLLHTKALLSTFSFLSSALPQRARAPPPEDRRPAGGTRSGLDASVSMQAGGQTEVFTRLRDIVVSDLKPGIVHRKVSSPPPLTGNAVSIVGGQEVFSFRLSLFPGATEGGGYSDMEKVDGKVTLRLGCIQILYLHQFLMALLDQFPSGSCCGGSAVMPDSMQFRVPSLIQGPVPFRVLLWRICRSCCGGSAVMADSMQFRVPSLIQGPAPFRVLLWRICSDA